MKEGHDNGGGGWRNDIMVAVDGGRMWSTDARVECFPVEPPVLRTCLVDMSQNKDITASPSPVPQYNHQC